MSGTDSSMFSRPLTRRVLFGGVAGGAALAAAGSALPASAGCRATVGATVPWVTVGAEAGRLGGGAAVRRISVGDTVGTVATLELEASGYAFVELKGAGSSVTITNTTGLRANAITVRASIPDAPDGGGARATLNLYVNGSLRQTLTFDSTQMWLYRGATTNPKDPHAGGAAHRFYNDFPFRIEGAPIAPGSTITLRKDGGNTAAWYAIDCVDFENVPGPLTRPANSLSVVDFGADPTFQNDSTTALQAAIDEGRAIGKTVWIPAGRYLTHNTTGVPLELAGARIQGAGRWHTVLYRRVPLPSVNTYRSKYVVGSGTHISDLQIDSNALYRGDARAGGADYSLEARGAGGWTIERVWTRHCDANWLSGSFGTVRDCRSSDSYGDGFNVNNSNVPDPDKLGNDMLIENNYQRNAGDDGFAVYSDAGESGRSVQVERVKFVHNTSVNPYWANGMRIAGGREIELRNNLVETVSANNAIDIGIFGRTGLPLESAVVDGNVFIGGGGWNSVRHGVHIGSPAKDSLYPDAYTNVTFTNNTVKDSLRCGMLVDLWFDKVVARDNVIENPAEDGVRIRTDVTGTGEFTGNQVRGLRAGRQQFVNESAGTFTVTGEGNSWQ